MELINKYKSGKYTFNVDGFQVTVIDDPSKFQLYKNLELPVFKKVKKKKDVDTPNNSASE